MKTDTLLAAIDYSIDKIANILTLFTCLLMVLLTATVLFEIFSRYIFNLPLTFTEELTSLFFPWIVSLTAIEVTKRDEHIAITVFSDKLPPVLRPWNAVLVKAIMLFFSVYMVASSYILCTETVSIHLPVLRFMTMAHLYSSITISFSFICLILVLQIVRIIFAKNQQRENDAV